MTYTIQGRMCGYLCDDCSELLEGVTVRLYGSAANDVVGRAAADPKDTMELLDEAAVASRAARLLGEATIGADGRFTLTLPDQGYDGGPFDIDLYCATVPHAKPPKRTPTPLQLHVTTLQPRWRETDGGYVAAFDYCVPARVWCAVRARLGAWTICGHVVVCETRQPIAGVTVKAFDVDWIQDDPLGDGITDAAGHFRIDYTVGDFTRTPFSPSINIELVGGPDLYFRVEGPGGTPLLVEPRSKGRTPGRQNVGPCTCVELCVTGDVPPQTVPTIPLFTKVGMYRIDPLFGEFTPAGTTTVGDQAFTGDIPLVGIMPDPLSPDAVEYRFLVAQLPGPSNPVDAAHLAATVIGELEYFAWDTVLSAWVVRSVDFWANNPGATVSIPQSGGPPLVVSVNTAVKPGGWIEAPRTNGLVPGGPGRFIPNGTLAMLHTTTYTDETFDLTVAAPPLPLQAGDSVPGPQRSAAPTFRVDFEARKVIGGAPVGSNTLAVIAFSNMTDTYTRHPYWAGGNATTVGVASLGIAEMVTNGGCAELGDTVHVLYTAYHPYAGQPTVYFDGNPILPAPLTPPVVGGQAVSAPGGDAVDISLLAKCAYILWLSVPLRLTHGYGSLGWILYDHIGFCKK